MAAGMMGELQLGRLALRAPAGVHVTGAHGPLDTVLDRLDTARLPGMRITGAATGVARAAGTVVPA